jgi:hypothetical protein
MQKIVECASFDDGNMNLPLLCPEKVNQSQFLFGGQLPTFVGIL